MTSYDVASNVQPSLLTTHHMHFEPPFVEPNDTL